MKKLIIIVCGALAAVAASLTVVSQATAAPDQTGQTFGQAKAALSGSYNLVVSSVVGDALPRDECIVVRQQATGIATPFYGSSGPHGVMINGSGNPKLMLSLDCNPHPK
jgi:hypothetical protein